MEIARLLGEAAQSHAKKDVREEAFQQLGRLGAEAVPHMDLLAQRLQNPDKYIAAVAAKALGRIATAEGVAAETRAEIARHLGEAAQSHAESRARRVAVEQLETAQIVESLGQVLQQAQDEGVAMNAAQALVKMRSVSKTSGAHCHTSIPRVP